MIKSMFQAKSLVAALTVALLLAAGDAKAAFTYSVSAAPLSQNFGSGSNYSIAPAFVFPATSGTLTGTQSINLAQTTQTSTTAFPATDTTVIPVSLTATINNLNGGGSGVITVSGNINVLRSDNLGANSTFTLTSILPATLTLGNFVYSLSGPSYTAPTIQGTSSANGGISILVTENQLTNPVPEPASLVMMGTSLLAIGGLRIARRRRQV